MKTAAAKMGVQVSLQYIAFEFVGCTTKSATVESYYSFIFSFCCCSLETSIVISIVAEPIYIPTRSV